MANEILAESPTSQLASLAFEMQRLRAAMPDGGSVAELASEIVERLAALDAPPDVVEVLRNGLIARQALVELGLKLS